MIKLTPVLWNLVHMGVQSAFTRALLLAERGATKAEIQAHIDKMKAEDKVTQEELDRLRKENM